PASSAYSPSLSAQVLSSAPPQIVTWVTVLPSMPTLTLWGGLLLNATYTFQLVVGNDIMSSSAVHAVVTKSATLGSSWLSSAHITQPSKATRSTTATFTYQSLTSGCVAPPAYTVFSYHWVISLVSLANDIPSHSVPPVDQLPTADLSFTAITRDLVVPPG